MYDITHVTHVTPRRPHVPRHTQPVTDLHVNRLGLGAAPLVVQLAGERRQQHRRHEGQRHARQPATALAARSSGGRGGGCGAGQAPVALQEGAQAQALDLGAGGGAGRCKEVSEGKEDATATKCKSLRVTAAHAAHAQHMQMAKWPAARAHLRVPVREHAGPQHHLRWC
jgi:hypothetical protein